jgi:hypothetical protein
MKMEKQENLNIAGRQDDSSGDASALATTREQVSDVYMEGTVDAVIDDVSGKDIPLSGQNKE